MFTPLEIVGDTAFRTTDQKVRGSNPFERAEPSLVSLVLYLQRMLSQSMKSSRVTALVMAACLSFAMAPIANAKAKPKAFNGKTCTIVGTSKSEKLTGTSKTDVICGLGGNDTIKGSGGNDVIDGGVGNDVISGGDGNDLIDGGTGNDSLTGDRGNDTITGDGGNDTLNGGVGNDSLQGETGSDILIGGAGTDTAKYSEKVNDLTLDIDNKPDDGILGEKDNIKTGVENVTGGSGNDTITGNSSANVISGGSGNDMMYGGSGNDMMYGGYGNDGIVGNAGVDILNGGPGRNYCKIDDSDPKYLTCAGNYLELAEKKIEGRVTYNSSTSKFKAVVQNKSEYWQNLRYVETHYSLDGEAKWGMGQGIGWVGPGQTAVVVGDWDPSGDLIPAQPELGIDAYETFGVFEMISSNVQWLRWDSHDDNAVDVETAHEIDPRVSILLGSGALVELDHRTTVGQVSFTATNTTSTSGPLTLILQGLNQKGEVICQGDNLYGRMYYEDQYFLQANSQSSGVVTFQSYCFDLSVNLTSYRVAFVSLKQAGKNGQTISQTLGTSGHIARQM